MKSRQCLTLSCLILLMLTAASCSEEDDSGTTPPIPAINLSGTIGATGGILATSDGRFSLTIPPNALDTDTPISITEVSADGVFGAAANMDLLFALTMTPADLEFNEPAMIEMVFDAGGDKRPDSLQETPLAIAAFSRENLENEQVTSLADMEVFISRDPRQVTNQVPLVRGFDGMAVGINQIEVLNGPRSSSYVRYGMDVRPGAVQFAQFDAEAALEVGPALELDSGIRFVEEELTGVDVQIADGTVVEFEFVEVEDSASRYEFDVPYVASAADLVQMKMTVEYDLEVNLIEAYPDEATRPVETADIRVINEFLTYAANIETPEENGEEIPVGVYQVGAGIEAIVPLRGFKWSPLSNTLAASGANATTFYSLGATNPAAPVNTDLQSDGLQDWGCFPIYSRETSHPEDGFSFMQFGPTGARLTSWIADDDEFGWSQLLQFQTAVTDAQPYGGDQGSGGFVYVSSGFGTVSTNEYNVEGGYFQSAASLSNFPSAPGNPFTAAVREGGGALVVTAGSPGKVYYHDLVNPDDPAVAVADAGNSPRRIRTLGDLAFISNFESDNLTVLSWDLPGTVAFIRNVDVGDGPVGIDAMEMPDGNIGVVSCGFNDNTYTLSIFDLAGALISNTTTNLPSGSTAPGHAAWLRGSDTHFGVSCNGSAELVVVDALAD